uniref:ANK_REP_REGION domain-containing protein n=1 Tax=Macrostomum lignano TaxID=282301 RepID=A0A1I8GM30_9PLAT
MNLLPELKSAAMDGRVGKVRQFLRSSVSPDVADDRQRTALHWAAERGQSRVARLLIEAGAQLDAQDSSGATALHLASMHVVQLLSRQADCDQQLADGDSPVHLAAQLRQQLVLAALLLAAADPSARNARGQTPLHSAALHGQRAAIELLVRAGVAADSLACDGSTTAARCGSDGARGRFPDSAAARLRARPAAIACRFGHREVLHLLLKNATHARELGIRHEGTNRRLQQLIYDRLIIEPRAHRLSLRSSAFDERSEQEADSMRDDEHLIEVEPEDDGFPACQESSTKLHKALKDCGFVLNRVKLQSACSDALQHIVRKRLDADEYKDYQVYIVGSYSDGWSNSLVRLDGQTDADSDIDVCLIAIGMLFHIKGSCSCINCSFFGERHAEVEYENGHVKWGESRKQIYNIFGLALPESLHNECLKPSLQLRIRRSGGPDLTRDRQWIWFGPFRCCCYPRIEVLQPGYKTCIAPSVLQSLRQEMLESPCHLVSAAPPGKDGQQLRVSTTFLERRLLRSLTIEQGHVFLLIKFIIKKVIAARVSGLKTYIAKTLMFQLLDETPAVDWHSSLLIQLARRALLMLLNSLRDTPDPRKCMRHFFLKDAWVYLKKHHDEKEVIALAVRNVVDHLPEIVSQYERVLSPLVQDKSFNFHPFLVLPILNPRPVPLSSRLQFHDVYDAIRSILLKLNLGRCLLEDKHEMLKLARRIPEYARSAKYSLIALIYLKFGKLYAARRVLHSCRYHQVSRVLPRLREQVTDADAELAVWEHLEGVSSIWKLLIQSDKPLAFDFLPDRLKDFVSLSSGQFDWYYVNFDALLKNLSIWLDYDVDLELWFEDNLRRARLDVQELLVTLELCNDDEILVRLIHKHRTLVCGHQETRQKAEELMQRLPSLAEKSSQRTVQALASTVADPDCLDERADEEPAANSSLVKLLTCFSLSLLISLAKRSRRRGFRAVSEAFLEAAMRKRA